MKNFYINIIRRNRLNYFFIGLLIISVFFIWLWILRFNTINSPFMRDEGEYAYAAQLLHTSGVPYKESFMQKPPMIIYTFYLAQIFSQNVWAPRVLALISLCITALIIGDILRREYNFKTAVVFLILFSPLISFSPLDGFFAQPEVFLLLPLAIILRFYFKWRHNQRVISWFIIGFFSAIAILFKPIIIPAILFIFIFMIIYEYRNNYINWKMTFYHGILFFLGGMFSSFIILLPVIVSGGFLYMLESAFLYNRYYAATNSFNIEALLYLLYFFWPILFLCFWFFVKRLKHYLFFLGLFLSCLVGTAFSTMFHYYLIIIPSITVIFAISLVDFTQDLKQSKIRWFKNILTIFIVCLLILFIYPFNERFFLNSNQIIDWTFPSSPFNAAVIMSKEVKKITTNSGRIFIWGNEPEILYYSNRKSVTRFVITYPIEINTKLSERYKNEIIKEIKNNPPDVIISYNIILNKQPLGQSNSNLSYEEYIINIIVNNYNFIGQVYTEEDGSSNFSYNFPDKNNINKTNLVLYEKK